MTGFSSTMMKAHNGAIFNCDIIQQTPPDLRQRALRLISGKYGGAPRRDRRHQDATLYHAGPVGDAWDAPRCTLAARVDSFHEASDGALRGVCTGG